MGSKDENIKFVEKNLRLNATTSTIDGMVYSLGIGMVPLTTTLTYFVSNYIHSNSLIGLLGTLSAFLINLPQLFFARSLETKSRTRESILVIGLMQRVPWLLMGLSVFFIKDKLLMILLFYLIYSFYSFACGLSNLTWFDLIVKVIPDRVRGRFFGLRTTLCSVTELLGAFMAAYILYRVKTPDAYGYIFILAFVLLMISFCFLYRMKEPTVKRHEKMEDLKGYFKSLIGIIKNDKNFRFYIYATCLAIVGGAAANFRIVYAKQFISLDSKDVQLLAALWVGSRAISCAIWGFVTDKKGFKFTLFLAYLIYGVSYLAMNFNINVAVLYLIFILHGSAEGAVFVVSSNLIVALGGEKRRATYIGLSAILYTPISALSPLLAGFISDTINYQTVFYFAGFIMLIAGAMLYLKVQYEKTE